MPKAINSRSTSALLLDGPMVQMIFALRKGGATVSFIGVIRKLLPLYAASLTTSPQEMRFPRP